MRIVLGFLFAIFSCSLLAATPVTAIRDFNTEKYLGSWYEVARLPMFFERNCRTPIIAHYRIDPKNSNVILVQNSCTKTDAKVAMANAVAHFTQTPNIAELKVSFVPAFLRWVPFTSGDYWVLSTVY
jgi:apolipoprotein D and lipocalin family protein